MPKVQQPSIKGPKSVTTQGFAVYTAFVANSGLVRDTTALLAALVIGPFCR